MPPFHTQRHFAATPVAVFAAFASAERLARWWGPAGFANEFERCDFRAGGDWVFTMVGPDGTRYPNVSRFLQIEADQRVLIEHVSPPHFRLRVSLTPEARGTRLQWEQTFDDPAVAQAVAPIVVPANEQNLDRLAAELGLA